MNGAEQKARGTAYEKMQKQLDELSIEIHNAWEVEVEARQKATILLGQEIAKEANRMESLFAKMMDDETQFRKHHVNTMGQHMAAALQQRTDAVQLTVYAFLKLPWWKRWGWVLFGFWFLEWSYKQSADETQNIALLTAEQNARRESGKAPMTQDNLRKAQSASERPQ